MALATTIPRYSKYQKILIDGNEVTLIDHLKDLRTQNKITKKKISNIIKQNDYWYSQIERSGKNGDDNRQKTIYRPDLINVIAIIKYGADSILDLPSLHDKSETYIDKIIKAVPITESVKPLEWYQLGNNRTHEEQDRLFKSLTNSIMALLQQTYQALYYSERNSILDSLKNFNASLKVDPAFIIGLAGLPFSEFLYESSQDTLYDLLHNIEKQLDEILIENSDPTTHSINSKVILKELVSSIEKRTNDYTCLRRRNYEELPSDKWDLDDSEIIITTAIQDPEKDLPMLSDNSDDSNQIDKD